MVAPVSNDVFIDAMTGIFQFLTICFSGIWEFLTTNTWLFTLVIAPVLVALIVFGVSLAISLTHKKDDGKGER